MEEEVAEGVGQWEDLADLMARVTQLPTDTLRVLGMFLHRKVMLRRLTRNTTDGMSDLYTAQVTPRDRYTDLRIKTLEAISSTTTFPGNMP